jgi:ATP-dependent exoDNAse (exonuclease V) beta subunit
LQIDVDVKILIRKTNINSNITCDMALITNTLAANMLKDTNPHERDARITFDEPSHTYAVDGSNEGYTSVTTLIHKLFQPFNADMIISKMMQSKKWPESQYFGMSREEIKQKWNANGKEASSAGTFMHAQIENFYNEKEFENDSDEWKLFDKFKTDHADWTPFRSEMIVFAEDLKLAGSIDMLYKDANGDLIMCDWKRSKEIKFSNDYQKGMHPLTKGLDDCNFNHYSLQLCIYTQLLKQYYDMEISACYLVILHPDQKKYLKIPVDDNTVYETKRRDALRALDWDGDNCSDDDIVKHYKQCKSKELLPEIEDFVKYCKRPKITDIVKGLFNERREQVAAIAGK